MGGRSWDTLKLNLIRFVKAVLQKCCERPIQLKRQTNMFKSIQTTLESKNNVYNKTNKHNHCHKPIQLRQK
eukprot:1978833-Amphidinium_carterae.1